MYSLDVIKQINRAKVEEFHRRQRDAAERGTVALDEPHHYKSSTKRTRAPEPPTPQADGHPGIPEPDDSLRFVLLKVGGGMVDLGPKGGQIPFGHLTRVALEKWDHLPRTRDAADWYRRQQVMPNYWRVIQLKRHQSIVANPADLG